MFLGSNKSLGGLAGGAAAGGAVALLLGSKKARKFAGNAATIGGMAVLGGLAYKAYQNWQSQKHDAATVEDVNKTPESYTALPSPKFQMSILKTMISAAKADGQIDADERKRIFDQVESLGLSAEEKGSIFDAFTRDINLKELAEGAETLEQKSDLYVAACLACNPDDPKEKNFLMGLALALDLPQGLLPHLEEQAKIGLS